MTGTVIIFLRLYKCTEKYIVIFPSFFAISFIDSACNLLLCEIITCALKS